LLALFGREYVGTLWEIILSGRVWKFIKTWLTTKGRKLPKPKSNVFNCLSFQVLNVVNTGRGPQKQTRLSGAVCMDKVAPPVQSKGLFVYIYCNLVLLPDSRVLAKQLKNKKQHVMILLFSWELNPLNKGEKESWIKIK
jgi:hypothetical protein